MVFSEASPEIIANCSDGVQLRLAALERALLNFIVELTERAIREGVRLLFSLANLKAEPTGALGIGALLESPETFGDRRVCCVVTGGNVDPAVYASLIAANDVQTVTR